MAPKAAPRRPRARDLWKPRRPEAPTQCASCPFRDDNDEAFGAVVKALREKHGITAPVRQGDIAIARFNVRLDVTKCGEFACHLTVYDPATMEERPPGERRQCPGATRFYREGDIA
jgi:hypothetical protein